MEQMNLLFFIASMGRGGAERATANLANYWARKGWKITVVTLAAAAGQDAYALDPSITRMSLNMLTPSRNIAHGLMLNIRRVRALREVLQRVRPDIALAVMDTASVTLALGARGLTGTVPVGWLQIHPAGEPAKAVWRGVQSITYGRLDALAVLTGQTASWAAANTKAKRIEIVPNPVPWPLPGSGPEMELQSMCKPERKLLLAAGRLVHQKGFDLLISAFASLCERHGDWDLVIVGEGPERARLEQEISAKELKKRIFLPGWAGNMANLYTRAQLYVMSSRFEGFPNTLAEAMAHGLAAVSFDCDTGPGDIIRDGIDGFLVPKEDVPALAASMDRLMADANLRARFGVAAQEIRDRYSLKRVAQVWETLFDKLLEQRRAVPAAA
jgi:glycosyltransferase involved in cell wall biosynthesis